MKVPEHREIDTRRGNVTSNRSVRLVTDVTSGHCPGLLPILSTLRVDRNTDIGVPKRPTDETVESRQPKARFRVRGERKHIGTRFGSNKFIL